MVITFAKLFQFFFGSLKVMESTQNVDFLTFDLDLGGSNQIIVLCASSHYGDHLCQIIKKI
jgi:hypothetical protein